VIVLSAVIMAGRFRPQIRGLRKLRVGLSALLVTLGTISALACMEIMWAGATYRGLSPDAGGMAVISGFYVFYPAAALIVLPFALNLSRLQPRLRRGFWGLCLLLILLPWCLLFGLRLLRHS
jgi:hypothetical protein